MPARLLPLAAVLLCWPAALAAAGPADGGTDRLPILGFQSDDSSPGLIAADARGLGSVGVDGVNLTGPGAVSTPTAADRAQLSASHRAGLPAVLLVGTARRGSMTSPSRWRGARSLAGGPSGRSPARWRPT